MTLGARYVTVLGVALLLVTGCAPGPPSNSPAGGQAADKQRAPKVLTIGIFRELDAWNTDLIRVIRGGGISTLLSLGHNKLVVENENFIWLPELALEQISIERGTWQLKPDNSMVTTWRLPRNAKWHDGTPFTSDDLLFTFSVIKDPDVPNVFGTALRVMRSASTPDPYTFVIDWSAPYVDVDQAPGLSPMPRHILEDTYLRDKANFTSQPWMTTDFVGLGPYRVARWERGSFMEFTRFDDYFKGRPPLDTVIVHFIPDNNTLIARLLAGGLDLVPALTNFDIDAALEVKRRWEGSQNHVGGVLAGRFATVETQHRLELARPDNGLANAAVRRAFYHALDRDELAQSMTQGLGPPADSWFFPGHELRGQVEDAIPRFPSDRGRAQRLLDEAGWTRGPDGILTNAAGGKFELQLAGTRQQLKLQSIIADSWRAIGARVEEPITPPDRIDDLQALSSLTGAWMATQGFSQMYTDRFHSSGIASPSNRWTGRNRSGYNSPRLDDIYDRLVATVAPAERLPLHRELLQEQMGNLVVMPLYWEFNPIFVTQGLKGIGNASPSNLFEWDKE